MKHQYREQYKLLPWYKVFCIHAVPATTISDVCAVYDMLNGTLQIIESTWIEVVRWHTVCCIRPPIVCGQDNQS